MTNRETARAQAREYQKTNYRKKNGYEDEPVEVVEYRVLVPILEQEPPTSHTCTQPQIHTQ
jgi:hypothetical protein